MAKLRIHIKVVILKMITGSISNKLKITIATEPFTVKSKKDSIGITEEMKYMAEMLAIASMYEMELLKINSKT